MVPTEVRDRATHYLKYGCEIFLNILQILFAPNLRILDFSKLESLLIKDCYSFEIMDSYTTDTHRNHI